MCRFQGPIVWLGGGDVEGESRQNAEESIRTPRIHSRYKSSTRLRWCTELVDEVAARARRVGMVVIGRCRENSQCSDFPGISSGKINK